MEPTDQASTGHSTEEDTPIADCNSQSTELRAADHSWAQFLQRFVRETMWVAASHTVVGRLRAQTNLAPKVLVRRLMAQTDLAPKVPVVGRLMAQTDLAPRVLLLGLRSTAGTFVGVAQPLARILVLNSQSNLALWAAALMVLPKAPLHHVPISVQLALIQREKTTHVASHNLTHFLETQHNPSTADD